MSFDCDVLVIGAGPGGYPAAIRAAQLGKSTWCVEKELLGGVCLNWGCIPSKALLHAGEVANQIRDASKLGLNTGELTIDYPKVMASSRKVAKRFNKGVTHLFKKYGVTRLEGTATITAPNTVEVISSAGTRTVTAEHIIIATGAGPRWFPGIEPDGERIVTYRQAIVATERPPSVVILGAGAIGIEFAYFWNAMGTDVTVVEGMNEIVPMEDGEIGAGLRKALTKQGIHFELGTFVDNVNREGDSVVVTLKDGRTLTASMCLVSLGITPNTTGIGLESVGIELGRQGFIKVDNDLRTTAPGFYAVGDCADAGPGLAHTATRQAHVVVERLAGLHVPDVDYSSLPACTYCQPQVASMGLTEAKAIEMGHKVKVGRFPFIANGKAVGSGHPEGFVKVVIDEQYGEILGAQILGGAATEMIAEFVLARASESLAETIVDTIHAHPTASEASMEAIAQALGVSVHI